MIKLLIVLGGLGMAGVATYMIATANSAPTPQPPAKPLFDQVVPSAISTTDQATTKIRYEDGGEKCGVRFQHVPDRSPERYLPETMSAGVVLADFNRDGAVDLFCVNSGSLVAPERPAGADHRLYLNDGRGRFTDVSSEWNVPTIGYGMGATAGDYDNDGWTDLLLTTYNVGERLLRNVGDGFVDVTEAAGLDSAGKWSTSAGFFDMDNDGDLDLYVARYIDYTLQNALRCYASSFHVYCTPVLYDSVPDRLLMNNGDGTFSDVTIERSTTLACKGLGLGIGDIDKDGDMDVYVANDTTRNFLLINDGKGYFTDIGQESGVAYSEIGVEEAGMGADFSDFDHDDFMDIVCTNFQAETTCLYRQGTGLFFREVADVAGVGKTARARLSFGIDFLDADNDGDEDLLMANGHIVDNIDLYREDVGFEQINTLYENKGDGRLVDVTAVAGPALQDKQVSRGLATGDLDGDGDLDYIVANNGGIYQIGINTTPEVGNFVSLWLEGRKANRTAIGARVEAVVGQRKIVRQICGASSYLSSCDPRIHLGLGDEDGIKELTIRWPGGEVQTIRNLRAGKFYRIVEGRAPEAYMPGRRSFES